MASHKITVELDLDPDMFRRQRYALIEMANLFQRLGEADLEAATDGLISLTDHIADVAADQYGLTSCLLTDETK